MYLDVIPVLSTHDLNKLSLDWFVPHLKVRSFSILDKPEIKCLELGQQAEVSGGEQK